MAPQIPIPPAIVAPQVLVLLEDSGFSYYQLFTSVLIFGPNSCIDPVTTIKYILIIK